MHSNASGTSNDSLHRENDNRTDDLVHTSSHLETDVPLHNSAEETSHVLPHRDLSPFRAHSPDNGHGSRPRKRGGSHDRDRSNASHSRLHLSLASILDAVKEMTSGTSSPSPSVAGLEERERGRTRARVITEEHSEVGVHEVGVGVAGPVRPNASHPSGHTEHREHHLLGLGRVFGFERDHEKEKDGENHSKEHGESWREFKPGESLPWYLSFLFPRLTNLSLGNGCDFISQVPTATRSPSCFRLIFHRRFRFLMDHLTTP